MTVLCLLIYKPIFFEVAKMHQFSAVLLHNANIVNIDLSWKPSFLKNGFFENIKTNASRM